MPSQRNCKDFTRHGCKLMDAYGVETNVLTVEDCQDSCYFDTDEYAIASGHGF